MIGKACISVLPYYDAVSRIQKFKSRPCLVIGRADSGDYVVLPISSVTDRSRLDAKYDIPLSSSVFTFLDKDSYLRTHKQTVVNASSLRRELADFRALYEETYLEALSKVEKFQNNLIENAF